MAALALASTMDTTIALPAVFVRPSTQVLNTVSEVVKAVKTMRDGRDGSERLLHQALKFSRG